MTSSWRDWYWENWDACEEDDGFLPGCLVRPMFELLSGPPCMNWTREQQLTREHYNCLQGHDASRWPDPLHKDDLDKPRWADGMG